jgi:hypothetical protein
MERPGDEFLPRSTLARHERGGRIARQPLDKNEQLEHRLAAGDHTLECGAPLELLLQYPGTMREVVLLEHRGHHALQAPEVDRFFDIVRRAELDRLHRILDRGVRCHEHEIDLRVALLEAS